MAALSAPSPAFGLVAPISTPAVAGAPVGPDGVEPVTRPASLKPNGETASSVSAALVLQLTGGVAVLLKQIDLDVAVRVGELRDAAGAERDFKIAQRPACCRQSSSASERQRSLRR